MHDMWNNLGEPAGVDFNSHPSYKMYNPCGALPDQGGEEHRSGWTVVEQFVRDSTQHWNVTITDLDKLWFPFS